MSPTLLLVLLIVTVAIAISQFGVILYFLNFIKKNELHDGAVKEAQTKSAAIILDAVDKANEVVATAEKKELDKVTESSKALEALTQNVNQSLQDVSQKTQEEITKTAANAQQALQASSKMAESSYTQFAQKTETTLQSLLSQDKTLLEQKTNQAIEQSSSMFQNFMSDVAGQVRKEIDEEIKKANEAVDTYKSERLAAINTKVIDILEEVLLETLGKKLTLKDEGEFVYQALEQAKKEHAFS